MSSKVSVLQNKQITPKYTFLTCPNCSGYGAKGKEPGRIECPSCKGKGVLKVEVYEQ